MIAAGILMIVFSCSGKKEAAEEKGPKMIEKKQKISITAVRYGKSLFSARSIFRNDTSGRRVNFHWLFYIVRIDKKLVLIDTGFNDEELKKRFSIEMRDPLELLSEMGITPVDVTDIIITHKHFDHAGNLQRFPSARIYINRMTRENLINNPYPPGIDSFLKNDPGVTIFDNEMELFNCIRIKHIGGHTNGSSVVYLDLDNKSYLFTGDEIYLMENYTKQIPSGSVYDPDKNREFLESIPPETIILPFHDPGIVPGDDYFRTVYTSR